MSTPSARERPPTVEDLIATDGSVSYEAAAAAVAATFGRLDGFDAAPAGTVRPIDGSAAIRWISGHLDRLTPAQRASLQKLVTAPSTGRLSGPLVAGPVPAPGLLIDETALDQLVDDLAADIAARSGKAMDAVLVGNVIDVSEDRPAGAIYAFGPDGASFTPGSTGPMDSCHVNLYGPAAELGEVEIRALVGSLVFQCWIHDQYDIEEVPRIPPWIFEGAAVWAGETLAGGSALGRDVWGYWIRENTERSLFARSQSAIGFFAQMAAAQQDPWKLVVAMADKAIAAGGSSEAAYGLVGGKASVVESNWGSSLHRAGGQLGDAWDIAAPGVPEGVVAPVQEMAAVDGEALALTAPPMTGVAFRVDLQAEVITIDASKAAGRMTIALDGGITSDRALDTIGEAVLCTLPDGCSCTANGATGEVEFQGIEPGVQRVGLTGGVAGSTLVLTGQTLADFCAPTCHIGYWDMVNDSMVPQEWLAPPPPDETITRGLGSYGEALLSFLPDGTWEILMAGGLMSSYLGPRMADGQALINLLAKGRTTGHYTIEPLADHAGHWIVTLTIDHTTMQTFRETKFGVNDDGSQHISKASIEPPPPIGVMRGPVEIACGDGMLTVHVPTPGGTFPVRFLFTAPVLGSG